MISSEEILIVAPTGADGPNIRDALAKVGLQPRLCHSIDDAVERIRTGAGVLLITEEALAGGRHIVLGAELDAQPTWSELPLVLVASNGSLHHWATDSARLLGARSNVTLVARPLRSVTLVAALEAVLRARRRQYQVRDLLLENQTLLNSLEARVQDRTAKLQELVAELESFSYSVSHDLRAPLRVIAGYAQVLLEDHRGELSPAARDYVERMERAADRMDRLTQDVLAYTRLARGEMPLAPVDVEAAVHETLEHYPQLTDVRSFLTLRRPIATVIAHRPSLVQALSNLIGNSVKFARPDVPLRITISTQVRGGRVRISIKDNGIGIDPAHHAKVFRLFERAVGQHVPGTGIGLAIVKKAAERMGGSAGVSSELGKGARFWVELAKA